MNRIASVHFMQNAPRDALTAREAEIGSATRAGMTVLYIDNTSTFGGAINSLAHLLRALDRTRFSPIVISGHPVDRLERLFSGCTCYRLQPKLSWQHGRLYRRIRLLPLFRIRALRRLLHLIRFTYWLICIYLPEGVRYYRIGHRHRVALVHLNNILGSQLPGIIAAKLLRVPCVAHLRDFEEIHPLTRFYARRINHHLAISAAIRDNLLQLGVPEEKTSLVHDGIDLEVFRPDIDVCRLQTEFARLQSVPRFGLFGRVVAWKGVREFIVAAQQVIARVPEAVAFVIGDPSDENAQYLEEMQALARQLQIASNVIFTGYRTDIAALMKFMDVIVHASVRPEPFGMTLVEGMALNRPVVATRAGGPLDIVVEGETGFLVEMGNSTALARAIVKLLRHPALAGQMGRSGRRRVETRFSHRRYAQQVEGVYRQVLGASPD